MTMTIRTLVCGAALLSFGPAAPDPVSPNLSAVFGQVGLPPEQRADVDAGRPAAKVVPWGGPSEVHVFGAIHIDGSPETYLKLARDVSRLGATPGYLAIGDLPASVSSSDLGGLTVDPDDLKALKDCRDGNCDVQLPTDSITAFHDAVDWSQPDVSGQVNGLARGMVLNLVHEYRRGGN